MKPYPGSLSHLLSSRVVSDFGVVAGDVTLLTREFDTYSHLLRFVSARSTRLRCLRDAALLRLSHAVAGPPGIDYDYLYNLSKHGKFIDGRPETQVFSGGRTFTYGGLPPFTQNKQKTIKKGLGPGRGGGL